MPYDCHVDPSRRFARVVFRGRVDVDQIIGAVSEMCAHPDWDPGFRILWDGRAITRLLIAPEEAPAIVEWVRDNRPRLGRGRTAVVVMRELDEEVAHLLMRWTGRVDERTRRLFRELEPAEAWLDVGPPPSAT